MEPQGFYDDPKKMFEMMTAGSGLPMPTFPGLAEVMQQANQYAQDIFSDRAALFEILERYEATLRKRWIKKTGEQRRKVLLTAFPNMPARHRPDFEAIRRENSKQIRAGTNFRDAFLLPSINLEDLLNPKHLLLFLASRGRTAPNVFINSDFNSIHLATVTYAITPSYLNGYTMLLTGQKTPSTYGRLVAWDDDVEAFDMMSKGTGIQPGEGLLVLEIQQRKLRFLLKCAQIILQDLPLEDPSLQKQPAPPEVVLGNEASEWPSLVKEVVQAPYRVPDKYDVSRLIAYISAKRDETQDHFWLLREDPSYFKDTVLDWSGHRQERVLTISGKSHPILRDDEFWERVLGNVVIEAYGSMVFWNLLVKDAENLLALRDRFEDQIEHDADLPEEYEHALCHFSFFVERATEGALGLWKVGMPASPPVRYHFYREPHEPGSTMIRVREKKNSFQEKDHFLWLLNRLTMDDQVFLCGLDNITDELERVIRSDPKNRDRLSSWLAQALSNLSLLGEIKRQIGLLKPGPPITEALPLADRQAEFNEKMVTHAKVHGPNFKDMELAALGTPLARFYFPSHKRRTATTTKEMQDAEANLDHFWQQVDDRFVRNLGRPLHQLSGVGEERMLRRTPDWIEPAQVPKRTASNTQDITHQFSAIELERRTAKTIAPDTPSAVRQKDKIRGAATEPKLETAEEPPTIAEPPKLTVSKRGFKVFSTLFYVPREDDPPGEIPWSEFLSAMASIGFSVKKLNGSAWVFAPLNDLFQRSIIFHEPHPASKIPYHIARRYGRRLERAYGWTGASFVRG